MDERRNQRAGADRIGEILLRAQLIERGQLSDALEIQRLRGGRLGHILIDQGFVDQEDFADALANQLGLPLFGLDSYVVDQRVGELLPRGTLEHHRVLPLQVSGGRVTLAMADPFNEFAKRELARASGFEVKVVLATSSDILDGIARLHKDIAGRGELLSSLQALRDRDRKEVVVPKLTVAV